MNNRLIDRQDVRVIGLLRRMEKVNSILSKLKIPERRLINGEHFITDGELSSILRISRRTLQEYRTAAILPYYLICGKILYKESEICDLLEVCRKRTIDEQELV